MALAGIKHVRRCTLRSGPVFLAILIMGRAYEAAADVALTAVALNNEVRLSWIPAEDSDGLFDHYAVYRSDLPFSSVGERTPIDTVIGVQTTAYIDTSARNGTSYHYAVTAVCSHGSETTTVTSVGPRTPRDETDLQIVCIARTPRYPRYHATYTTHHVTEPSGFGPYKFTAATGLGQGQTPNTPRWPAIDDAAPGEWPGRAPGDGPGRSEPRGRLRTGRGR